MRVEGKKEKVLRRKIEGKEKNCGHVISSNNCITDSVFWKWLENETRGKRENEWLK